MGSVLKELSSIREMLGRLNHENQIEPSCAQFASLCVTILDFDQCVKSPDPRFPPAVGALCGGDRYACAATSESVCKIEQGRTVSTANVQHVASCRHID